MECNLPLIASQIAIVQIAAKNKSGLKTDCQTGDSQLERPGSIDAAIEKGTSPKKLLEKAVKEINEVITQLCELSDCVSGPTSDLESYISRTCNPKSKSQPLPNVSYLYSEVMPTMTTTATRTSLYTAPLEMVTSRRSLNFSTLVPCKLCRLTESDRYIPPHSCDGTATGTQNC
jgi:hypothetical protein